MKKMNQIIILCFTIIILAGCDKKFETINFNPQQVRNIDPGYLFTNAQRGLPGPNWLAESTIIQQFVLPYNLGVTSGYQFNENVDGLNSGPFNAYTGSLKNLEHILPLLKDDPSRSNLYNQTRILRAYVYMWLVDHYGAVPYSEAGKAYLDVVFFPEYERDADIYNDLYNEIKTATGALDAGMDNTTRFDIFVTTSTSTADQVTFWKKFGYSLLLRLGMRYSKLDANKAMSIVQEAYNGGVMETNNDNVIIRNMDDGGNAITGYTNGLMNAIRNVNPFNYYLAEPLVTTLKAFSDPRLKYISARYVPSQSTAPSVVNPDTTSVNQHGFPVGYDDASLVNYPGYRPAVGTGQDYSQINYNVVANTTSPVLVITNAQTKLLLAEAAFRGWLTGLPGAKTAQQYYEEGVRASMDGYTKFPNTTPISVTDQNNYLAMPGVAYNATDALELINTQYWIECFNNGYEGWCNFRRSGFPDLSPNLYNNNLNGGFIRRFSYPLREVSVNAAKYTDGVALLGGADFLTTRIFWDIP